MKTSILPILLLPLLLTGCGSDSLADRVYAQALELSEDSSLHLTLQSSEDESVRAVHADTLEEALRLEEALSGGHVFIGHTELVCLDRSVTPDTLQALFYENGVSPGCKLLYSPSGYLKENDSTPVVHTLRLAEQDGLLTKTDLSTALEEWLGAYQTALLPVPGKPLPGLLLMHADSTCLRLTDSAARGMLWLRQPPGKVSVTVGSEQIELRSIRLCRTWQEDHALYSLTAEAQDCDPETRTRLQEQLTADCQAAAETSISANADVIGLQTLLEANGIPLPETLPAVTVQVMIEP